MDQGPNQFKFNYRGGEPISRIGIMEKRPK